MLAFIKIILIGTFLIITNCSYYDLKENENQEDLLLEIKTTNDKYNIIFKENLKRFFYINNDLSRKYILNTSITFQSSDTLSISGKNVLKSTKATINYSLIQSNTNKIIRSGSINTFPALSSSSSSLYTQQKSIEHIKKRLISSSAKSLYMHIKIILSGLR